MAVEQPFYEQARRERLKKAGEAARAGKPYAYINIVRNGSNHVAHYRGELQGKGNVTTRLGEKSTGIRAAVYGWNSRVEVSLEWDDGHKRDIVKLVADGITVLRMPFEDFAKGEQAIVEHIARNALEKHSRG